MKPYFFCDFFFLVVLVVVLEYFFSKKSANGVVNGLHSIGSSNSNEILSIETFFFNYFFLIIFF
jgi:hypothetical protein